LIEMVPLEHCLEDSGEPDLIIDRSGNVVFATTAAKSLAGATLPRFDADDSLEHLLADWSAQRESYEYTGVATLRLADGAASPMRLAVSIIDYRGVPHLLGRLRPLEHPDPSDADLWSDIATAARDGAFAAVGAVVEHEINQSLAAIVNYVQTSVVLLGERAEGSRLVRDALSDAGRQALRCADMLRALRHSFSFQDSTLVRHSLNGVVRQAQALLATTRAGRASTLALKCEGPEVFAQLSHTPFLWMLFLLMQRCVAHASSDRESAIEVGIESGNGQVILRFPACRVSSSASTAPGGLFFERLSSGKDDVRLFAICQATMRLHGGHVSIAGDQGNPGVQLVLPKAGAEEGRYG